jgi:hypothetical protein
VGGVLQPRAAPFLDQSYTGQRTAQQARWFADWRVGFPTDGTVVQRIAGWREHAGAWNDARRGELRMMFGEADAM